MVVVGLSQLKWSILFLLYLKVESPLDFAQHCTKKEKVWEHLINPLNVQELLSCFRNIRNVVYDAPCLSFFLFIKKFLPNIQVKYTQWYANMSFSKYSLWRTIFCLEYSAGALSAVSCVVISYNLPITRSKEIGLVSEHIALCLSVGRRRLYKGEDMLPKSCFVTK